jgi:hypothetical protein
VANLPALHEKSNNGISDYMTPSNNNDPASPVGDYGGGISAKRIRLENTRLLERALREHWPIPNKYRKPVVDRQVKIAIDPGSSAREATSAARCLASMSSDNAAIVLKLLDKVAPDQHAHTIDDNTASIEKLLTEAEYVEFLRNRTSHEDCDSGAICQIRQSVNGKALENGSAYGGSGPGANGHRNGQD